MKGVIERGEGRNRGITEAERADKRRAKRWGRLWPEKKRAGL